MKLLTRAGSSDLFECGEMAFRRAAKVGVDPAFQFSGREQSIGLDHVLFAMHPLGFDRIKPRALGRQQARENADTCAALFDEARLWV